MEAQPENLENYAWGRTGIHLEMSLFKLQSLFTDTRPKFSCFIENEVLLDGNNGMNFYPASTNFIIGLKMAVKQFELKYQHECRHPHEGRGDKTEQYNLIEGRIYLK